ncbi:hypothetical protein AN958_06090 [Leucoagaricus sp. SymC.cos]|nr:hypothetical protein AN958_06090 [Leucoagaricus sp. SymC.cos]
MRIALPFLLLPALAAAQSSLSGSSSLPPPSASSARPSSTFPTSLSLTTGSATITTSIRSNGALTQVPTVVPTTFNVTFTLTPTATSSSASASADTSATSSPSPAPIVLDTRVDPAFGVLGAILILTGLPSAFWGHKNRWTSFFLTGFYSLSLVCSVLILRYGVLPAVNPPSKTLRGMYVLASVIAGVAGGGVAIFFWKAARYCIGAWGGFALALWIQSFHNGGVIKPIGYRWILYIGKSSLPSLGVLGFTFCTIPKIHYHVLLISTAIVGSSAFILGVDCFTTAGLKEFYMWNLGFDALFPKFTENFIQFPVSQTMQIELGLIGAVTLMGAAVQLRIMKILKRKLREIAEEARRQDEAAELEAATRFVDLNQERETWEKEHPTLGKHGRQESTVSSMAMMKEREGSSSPTTLAEDHRQRHLSGLSEFKVAPPPDEDLRKSRFMQNPGALPALDLGLGIQDDVPANFITGEKEKEKENPPKTREMTIKELEDLKKKEQLMYEIENIRKNIETLKKEPTVPVTSSSQSRRLSMASRRTLSIDASTALLPAANPHSRPPRETDPRARVHSMDFSSASGAHSPPLGTIGESLSRPSSVPLKDSEWDLYLHERKLLQPPSGVTPPIQTTPAPRVPMSTAVQEALDNRKRRESLVVMSSGSGTPADGSSGGDDPDDVPLAKLAPAPVREKEKRLSGLAGVTGLGNMGYSANTKPDKDASPPVTILPPRRNSSANLLQSAPAPSKGPIVKTFEELNERHREKMKNLQGPVTKAEKESADVRDAKERWERAKKAEKETMMRKQAEKAAALKKSHGHGRETGGGRKDGGSPSSAKRDARSPSADMLGNGSSSKKLSVLKVEDWQRFQATTGSSSGGEGSGSASGNEFGARRRDSIPFPGQSRGQHPGRSRSRDELGRRQERKKSRDLLN